MARLLREGPVLVLNIFTGYLSNLKIHGAVLGAERYREEIDAANFMGFESVNLGELDAPFRRTAYQQLGNIFRPPVAEDLAWLEALRVKVFGALEQIGFQELYVPLGVGWHVDHVLTYMLFDTWVSSRAILSEDIRVIALPPPHSTRDLKSSVSIRRHACYVWAGSVTVVCEPSTRSMRGQAAVHCEHRPDKNVRTTCSHGFSGTQLRCSCGGLLSLPIDGLHRKFAPKTNAATAFYWPRPRFKSVPLAMRAYTSQFSEILCHPMKTGPDKAYYTSMSDYFVSVMVRSKGLVRGRK